MTHKIFDAAAVDLTCRRTASLTLEFFHDDLSLERHANKLFNELRTVSEAELRLHDFAQDGVSYRVHVWESCDDGSHIPWLRDKTSARSGPRETMSATLLVCTMPADDPPPEPNNGPPAPGAGQSLITVKFRKRGSKPF